MQNVPVVLASSNNPGIRLPTGLDLGKIQASTQERTQSHAVEARTFDS